MENVTSIKYARGGRRRNEASGRERRRRRRDGREDEMRVRDEVDGNTKGDRGYFISGLRLNEPGGRENLNWQIIRINKIYRK